MPDLIKRRHDIEKIASRLRKELGPAGMPVELQNEFDRRALSSITGVSESIVQRALTNLPSDSSVTLEAFKSALETVERTPGPLIAHKKYCFVIPLEFAAIEGGVEGLTFECLGKTFSVGEWGSLLGPLTLHHIFDTDDRSISNQPKYALACGELGINEERAWQSLETPFQTLLGVLEFEVAFGWTSISSLERPRAFVPHPKLLVVYEEEKTDAEVRTFELDDPERRKTEKRQTLTKRAMELVERTLRVVNEGKEDSDVRSLIASVLRLYSEAANVRRSSLFFLTLWQCIELLTLVETHRGSGEKACSRLATLFLRAVDVDSVGVVDVFRQLMHRRNSIVHKGIFNYRNQDDGMLLKQSIDFILEWLLHFHRDIPTISALEQFYQWHDLSDSKIDGIEKTIAFIRNERNTPKGET